MSLKVNFFPWLFSYSPTLQEIKLLKMPLVSVGCLLRGISARPIPKNPERLLFLAMYLFPRTGVVQGVSRSRNTLLSKRLKTLEADIGLAAKIGLAF